MARARKKLFANQLCDRTGGFSLDSRKKKAKLATKNIHVGSGPNSGLIHEYQTDSASKQPVPLRILKIL